MKKWYLVLVLAFGCMGVGFTQDYRLAQQYYSDGEYEKASFLFEKLYKESKGNSFFFERYVDCLTEMGQFSDAETVITKEQKANPDNLSTYLMLGKVYEKQNNEDKAIDAYELAISRLPKDEFQINRLASAFTNLNRYDLGIRTFEEGKKLLKNDELFAYELAEMYRRKGDVANMVKQLLFYLDAKPEERLDRVKTKFQIHLADNELGELQNQLYTLIQGKPERNIHYVELLAWVFMQKKDYTAALRQVRSLDRIHKENGGRVYELGTIAANAADYEVAIEAFDYIVANKGEDSPFFMDAKRALLYSKRQLLASGQKVDDALLESLETEYEEVLGKYGFSSRMASIIMEYAELQGLYMNNIDKAIKLLSELIAYPGLDPTRKANAKLALGDYYLIQGDHWESTLLYSQVDKDFKEDVLGQEARYKNARLSYYTGDFEWSQSQCEVLKASTSKFIANDALDLSIFIMDNLAMDSTDEALKLYSAAELLVFQNKYTEAFTTMDTLLARFPFHSLDDDVLYLRAGIYRKQGRYEEAIALYEQVIGKDVEGIRADNSLYAMGIIFEENLSNKTKAMEAYEKIFVEYASSTLASDARKRFRRLRGDDI